MIMETIGIITCYALSMGFVFGVGFFLMTVVEHHRDLRRIKEEIRDLHRTDYGDYWAFNGRIDALEKGKMDRTVRGEDDGKVKAKG